MIFICLVFDLKENAGTCSIPIICSGTVKAGRMAQVCFLLSLVSIGHVCVALQAVFWDHRHILYACFGSGIVLHQGYFV